MGTPKLVRTSNESVRSGDGLHWQPSSPVRAARGGPSPYTCGASDDFRWSVSELNCSIPLGLKQNADKILFLSISLVREIFNYLI